jgi:predicted RND superfamily exporter protein
MWNFLIRHILRDRIAILSVIAIITGFMAFQATKVRLSYKGENVLPKTDSTAIAYQKFKAQFGEDGTVVFIGIRDTNFFTLKEFNDWYRLTLRLRAIKGVEEVVSVTRLYTLVKNDSLKKFEFHLILAGEPSSQSEVDSVKKNLMNLPFYHYLILNPENYATLMAITLDSTRINSKDRWNLVKEIRAEADSFSSMNNTQVHYSGLPYIRTITAKKLEDEMKLFVLLALLISAIFLFIFFRSFKAVIYPMMIVVVSVTWALGFMGLFGYKITMLTAIIPPLLIVIGVENCIFILNKYHYEFNLHRNKIKALSRVIHRIGIANLLTNAATATGFAAFTITNNKLLIEFGTIAAINIMVIYVLSLTLVPILYSFLPPPRVKDIKHIEESLARSIIDRAVFWVTHYRNVIYVILLVIIGIAMFGVVRLETRGTIVDDISKKDPIYKDILFFEENFKGVMPLEIVVDTKKKKGVVTLNTLRKIDRLQDSLKTYPELAKPLSVVELIKSAKQAFYGGDSSFYSLPGANEMTFMADYIPEFKAGKRTLIKNFIDTNYQVTRISAQMANIGTKQIEAIQDRLLPTVDSIFPRDKFNVTVTGSCVTFLKGTNFLIRNLWESIALAVVVIAILLAFLFTSWRMILISLIPNLIPQLFTAALMGFLDIPIKPSTILIFSIALGISVDNSIQFLSRYRLQLKYTHHNIPESVLSALKETGYSMIYSSTVLFFGFAIFMLSTFGGTQALGFLVSFTLLVGGLLNLFVLPSMLLTLDKWSTTRAFEQPPLIDITEEENEVKNEE